MFPAGAGVIPITLHCWVEAFSVSRRRGGDPKVPYLENNSKVCFPQARG